MTQMNPPPPPPPPGHAFEPNVDAAKGFLGSLFDLSFTSFVTPKMIQVIFVIKIIAAGLVTLMVIISGFTSHWAAGILFLLLSPLLFLVLVLMARIWLELVIVMFRIYETLRDRGGSV